MTRSSASFGLALGALALGGIAVAEPTSSGPSPTSQILGRRIAVITPPSAFTGHAASKVLYLNRCIGGCVVYGGANDAKAQVSSIPNGAGPFNITAYSESTPGEWDMVVQCMKEVYSPYSVQVTDVLPTSGSWNEAIIAGVPNEIGQSAQVLGIAPLAGDCSAMDNAISFSFANQHPALQHVLNVCWTAAQESAHVYGLDHEFKYADGANVANHNSACNDPMTYSTDCGGEKFFRNHSAECGEYTSRACRCGATQNSHLKVLSVFGPATPITTPPTSEILMPLPDTTLTAGQPVQVRSGAQRGVDHLDLYLNGFKWGDPTPGAAFGAAGQPTTTYSIPIPDEVPDSIVDIVVKAYDDLGIETDSAMVTVTKGAPCTTADACAMGQKCEGGRCFWDPPTGVLGDTCSYDQFCTSLQCSPTAKDRICTQDCVPGTTDSCPMGYSCLMSSPGQGFCYFPDSGGCCNAGHESNRAMLVHIGFGAMMLGIVLRRRRR